MSLPYLVCLKEEISVIMPQQELLLQEPPL